MHRTLISATLLLFGIFRLYAQKIPDYSLKHNMKQNGLSMEFTVLDSDKKPPSRHHTNKIYFWYKAQQVIQTQGGHAGVPLDGLFRSFYQNKQLCDQGEFRKGLKSGTWTYWNPTGTLNRKESWKNGEQRGKQYYYNPNGQLQKIVTISRYRGKQQPDSLEWIRGRHTKITVYDSTGRKTATERYNKGLQDGKSVYYSDSSSHTVVYRNGIAKPKKTKKSPKEETPASGAGAEKKTVFQRLLFWKKKDPSDTSAEKLSKKNNQSPEKTDRKKKVKEPEENKASGTEPQKEPRPKKNKKSKSTEQ